MSGKAKSFKPQSQDYFPKNSNNSKSQGFIFNQAPLNKKQAQQEAKEKKTGQSSLLKKRSAFMARLYQDDEEFENEMKVFNLGSEASGEAVTKRRKEEVEKKGPKPIKEVSKIGKLKFNKGSIGLFAINEIHEKYLIVNYTRNVKGYVALNEQLREVREHFRVGQYLLGYVESEGTHKFNEKTSGHQNKKVQLKLDLQLINQYILSSNMAPNMILQGQVESKEAKGYLINFGLKDKVKGFVALSKDTTLSLGSFLLVQVKEVVENSKIVKCEMLNPKSNPQALPQSGDYTNHLMKPGFLVNGRVLSTFENGITVSFLGGLTGSIFADHLSKESPEKYKNGEKIVARIITADSINKIFYLSTLNHIVRLQEMAEATQDFQVGQVVENAEVSKALYGGSYLVKLGEDRRGFLHKIHTSQKEGAEDDELEVGMKIDKLIVKEYNYFDGMPLLSSKEHLVKSPFLDYKSLQIGQILQGTITHIDEKKKCITISLNDFVKGKLHLEHMSGQAIKFIPPKLTTVGKSVKVMVWQVDPEARLLEFTKKPQFVKDLAKLPVYSDYSEINKGDKVVGVIVGETEYGYVLKSFGGIKGLVTFEEIKQNGKRLKQDYKFGSVVQCYTLFKKKDQGLAITLNKKLAKELREKVQSNKENLKKVKSEDGKEKQWGKVGTLNKDIVHFEDLTEGEWYKAQVTKVNLKNSNPISIQLSGAVKSNVHFSAIVTAEEAEKEGIAQCFGKFKLGNKIDVLYKNKKFEILEQRQDKNFEKGELVIVRGVKIIPGKGVTVQINEKIYGFIEICEITDQFCGQVSDIILDKVIFLARIINFDKQNKPMLSSRESIIASSKWTHISPAGKSITFQKQDASQQKQGNLRNKILKYGANTALTEGELVFGYVTNLSKSGCFVQLGHQCTARAALNELSDKTNFNYLQEMAIGMPVLARVIKVEDKGTLKRFSLSLRQSVVVYGIGSLDRQSLSSGTQVKAIVTNVLEIGKAFGQIKGSSLKLKLKGNKVKQLKEGDHVVAIILKVTKQKITGEIKGLVAKEEGQSSEEEQVLKLWTQLEQEQKEEVEKSKKNETQKEEMDVQMFENNEQDEVGRQMEELEELKELEKGEEDDEEDEEGEDSDQEEMKNIIEESKFYSDNEEEEEDEENAVMESDGEESEQEEEKGNDSSSEEEKVDKKSGKKALKSRIKEEQEIRKKEQAIKSQTEMPASIDDFERLLFGNPDQSYLWIQYIAFLLEKLGIESARRAAERAVKAVAISNEDDKQNLWVAYMNLENGFGTQESLLKVVKRALEVNDRQNIYLQLVSIYKNSHKYQHIEDIYKLLAKKYNSSLPIWSEYMEFLFEIRSMKQDKEHPFHYLVSELEFSEPKAVLQRGLQALPKSSHIALISKNGMLEFKYGSPENGRTMLEGIVNNFPKRMDIWSVYMDMEMKYGGQNKVQARHLFERCLAHEQIKTKPKKMKLAFQKYMEFESSVGNKKNVDKLKKRVEEYLEQAYKNKEDE